jgi:2-polyprenyl-6-methoxyphenol hydroxylase-like FAD-dependent oxidoreductase
MLWSSGRRLVSSSLHPTTRIVTAVLKDGSQVEGLALIGADGCFFHTRRQLPPSYSLKDSEVADFLIDDLVAAHPAAVRNRLGVFSTDAGCESSVRDHALLFFPCFLGVCG